MKWQEARNYVMAMKNKGEHTAELDRCLAAIDERIMDHGRHANAHEVAVVGDGIIMWIRPARVRVFIGCEVESVGWGFKASDGSDI